MDASLDDVEHETRWCSLGHGSDMLQTLEKRGDAKVRAWADMDDDSDGEGDKAWNAIFKARHDEAQARLNTPLKKPEAVSTPLSASTDDTEPKKMRWADVESSDDEDFP